MTTGLARGKKRDQERFATVNPLTCKSRTEAEIRAGMRFTRFYKNQSTLTLGFFGRFVDFPSRLTKRLFRAP
ncbi:MAG TPA: hypothetical protein VKP69_34910, partial [Isosphaeraceae bacterium]|nr:hypothetical protein [Isosphaeraceae bacterium]